MFLNRAAELVIGSSDPIQSGTSILGQAPVELGIKLLYNWRWNVVLDKLASAQKEANLEGHDGPVHELDAVVSNTNFTYERYFRYWTRY